MAKHPRIVLETYDFLKYLLPVLAKFPKDQRYLLAERIETHLLDILELFIEAQYSADKAGLLRKANLMLEKLRFLVRLSFDMRFVNVQRYEYCAGRIDLIGSQAGGWLKQQGGKS